MRVAVLDHGMGNLRSVEKALQAAGADAFVTADAETIESCDALCVPGQGVFGRCIDNLTGTGLDRLLVRWVDAGRPYLGICLGMQVLFEASDERGPVRGLGILGGRVTRLPEGVTVPHIGWNTVGDEHFYFDHSYAVEPDDPSIVSGWTDYGREVAARVEFGSILGVQFHPEKSGRAGIALLEAWLAQRSPR